VCQVYMDTSRRVVDKEDDVCKKEFSGWFYC